MIKLLITGSNGQLGSHFNNLELNKNNKLYINEEDNSRTKNSLFDIIPSYYKKKVNFVPLDITNENEVKRVIDNYKPDVIINAAAITDVDFCESNKSLARKVNVEGLKFIIKHSSSDMKIIQISSDFIYDGIKGFYNEESMPNPINYYGKTKLEAENILLSSHKNFIIIRVSTLYSNYANNFYKWVLTNLKNNNNISIVDDQISNPCYALNLVNLIFDLILLDYNGKINFGSNNNISRLEFGLKIAELNGLNKDLIQRSKTEDLNFISKRPLNTSFDLTLSKKLNLNLFSTNDTLEYISKL